MGIKGKASGGTGENPYGDGVLEFKLIGITAMIGEKFETKEPIPQMTLHWQDDDGDAFDEKFVSVPKNFGINDKSKLVERIAALLGKSSKALADEGDDSKLEFDAGLGIESYEEFVNALASGRQIKMGINYDGASIFNKNCNLLIETSEKGWAKVRSSSPIATTGTKKKAVARELESVI